MTSPTVRTGSFTQSGGSTVVNGSLNAPITINGGTLSGAGTISGAPTNNGGTVSASDAPNPDIMTVNGYRQGSGGTLLSYPEGTTPGAGGYSQLDVNGTASLDGTLDVDELSAFEDTAGEDFYLLTASDGVTGTFS